MRHRVAGKQLSRTTSHRKALRRNMAASLFQHGAIRTTEAKAKELRPFVERLITIARQGTLHARRRIIKLMQDREIYSYDESQKDFVPDDKTIVQKLFDEVAPRYVDRPGGYTRIIRLSERRIGDGGVQVVLQLVDDTTETAGGKTSGRREKQAAKRHAAVESVLGGKEKTATPTLEENEPEAETIVAADAEESTETQSDDSEEPKSDEAPAADEGEEKTPKE
jgi:large subunit ribosomal protein L17